MKREGRKREENRKEEVGKGTAMLSNPCVSGLSLCTLEAAHYLGLFDSALRIVSAGSKGVERSNGRPAFSGVELGANGVFDT